MSDTQNLVHKRKRKDKDGNILESKSYHTEASIGGRDVDIALYPDKGESNRAALAIRELLALHQTGSPLGRNNHRFLDECSPKLRKRIVELGIVTDAQGYCTGTLTIEKLVEDYRRTILHNPADYVTQNIDKANRLIQECGWKTIQDITTASFVDWREARLAGETTKSFNTMRSEKRAQRKDKLAPGTCDKYLLIAAAMCEEAVDNGNMGKNPFKKVKPLGIKRGRPKERGVFTWHEALTLVWTTYEQNVFAWGMTGIARAVLYLLCLYLGLRYSEGKLLSLESFAGLDTDFPKVTVKDTKNGDTVVMDVPAEVMPTLTQHLRTLERGSPVFSGGHRKGKGAEMIREDMARARIAERDMRENERDFHSLRHTYCTQLALSGVHPAKAQKLMCHSDINLTARYYTHIDADDLKMENAKLPACGKPEKLEE